MGMVRVGVEMVVMIVSVVFYSFINHWVDLVVMVRGWGPPAVGIAVIVVLMIFP